MFSSPARMFDFWSYFDSYTVPFLFKVVSQWKFCWTWRTYVYESFLTINCHLHRFFYFTSPIFNWLIIYLNSLSPFGEGNGNPLQYSCLENPMDRGTLQATVHGVTKSRAQLSNLQFLLSFPAFAIWMRYSNIVTCANDFFPSSQNNLFLLQTREITLPE